jgi:GNAT superfamily N-acetyltransferase
MTSAREHRLTIAPASPKRWPDLERLFGPRGACGGCWCMHWRLTAADYEAGKGPLNRRRLKDRVEAGSPPPGLIAYADDEPIGWCALGPRSEFLRFERSRILGPVDDRPVWSIVCFFVAPRHRARGVTRQLLSAAVELAAAHGATVVEGYPVQPQGASIPPVFAFTGLASVFADAGFREVARRSATRPIMRRHL